MMSKSSFNMVTVILAAGASKRMGEPKQLLKWGNSTLLEHAIHTVLKFNSQEVIVVLGADFEVVKNKISDYPITVLNNTSWEMGLGKSIAFALEYIRKSKPQVDSVLITLADQPLIDTDFLNRLFDKFNRNNNSIVATSYKNGKYGVPVIFNKNYFEELALLKDDNGAKILLKKNIDNVDVLKPQFENLDVDSKEEYDYLCGKFNK